MTEATRRPVNLFEVRSDTAVLVDTFREDVIDGLTRGRGEKFVHPKHLYDAEGSRLFERITQLDDYYPTRTEASIYAEQIDDICARLGRDVTLIEPGAHTGEKALRLLEHMDSPHAFAPMEISRSALEEAGETVAGALPSVEVYPVCADFTAQTSLLDHVPRKNRVVFFPGSTIGNLVPEERRELLGKFAEIAGAGGRLLLGYDLKKDPSVLERAYDDSEGVTAAFNFNLLDRINRELDGEFDRDAFAYRAKWEASRSRIEMGLVSERDQTVKVNSHEVRLAAGEFIHTENSHKFEPESLDAEAAEVGFTDIHRWTDEKDWFCVSLFERK